MTEIFNTGDSRGWDSANFAVAYEGATKVTEPSDPIAAAVEAGYTNPADQLNFATGYAAGWNRYMRQNYPD